MAEWDGIDRRKTDRRECSRREDDYQRIVLHPDNLRSIGETILDRMQSECTVPSELHKMHHDFIQMLINREKRRADFLSKLIESSASWGLLGLLGFVGWAIWEGLKNKLHG